MKTMNNPWKDIQRPSADFSARLINESHPLRLYWGRDSQGRYLFIFEVENSATPDGKSLPRLTGISVAVSKTGENHKLVLMLNDTSNWELFHALCDDLVRATQCVENQKSAGTIFLRRLTRWQDFLKRERPGIMPVERIKGLIGELLFLTNKVTAAFTWEESVNFWKGPEEAPQDFAIHETAIEVKCQSGGSKPTVRITSAEQLEPQLPEGYLAVYTLASADKEDPNGFTLNSLVADIRSKLEETSEAARERFEDLLFMAGYIYSEEYERYRFTKVALRCYKIEENFPRIRTTGLSQGIERITYSLKLEACASFEKTPIWWKGNNES